MTDQEKRGQVIKGLEVCSPTGCAKEKCPYYEGPESEFWSNPDGYECEFNLRQNAIKLLKTQEPRVMTEQEMRDAEPGAVIYCEQRDEVRTYLTPLIKYDDGVFENRFLGAEPEATQLPNVRFWTSRPTDEQREATPWND